MNNFLEEKEKLLNSIENNTSEHWKEYYKNVPIDCIFDDLVIDINEIKRLTEENQELKADYGTKAQVERDLLMEENQELKEQFETGEQQYNRLVEEKEELQEQLSSITFRLEKQKEILDRIKKVCESIPADWSICGIEVVSRIENNLKEEE